MSHPPTSPDPAPALERPPQDVLWHDLTPITGRQTIVELLLPLPWLAASWVAYGTAYWWLGPLASFMFFLCALRLNHEAIHGNLGLSRSGDSIVMHVLSAGMLGSNHADAYCHLKHHQFTMGPDDHEGKCGHMRLWQVLAYGPRFPVDLNLACWTGGSARWRRLMLRDWGAIAGFAALCLLSGQRFLLLHLAVMALAQCLTAFLCGLDHPSGHRPDRAGRTQPARRAGLGGLFDVLSPRTSSVPESPRQPPARTGTAAGCASAGLCGGALAGRGAGAAEVGAVNRARSRL